MLSKYLIIPVLAVASTLAASCGGRGSFTVNQIGSGFGGVTLNPRSVQITQRGNGQICIVNRAPNTAVTINADQVNDAVNTVLGQCCSGQFNCAGGQQKITASTGNVIDLSVQGLGQDCTA